MPVRCGVCARPDFRCRRGSRGKHPVQLQLRCRRLGVWHDSAGLGHHAVLGVVQGAEQFRRWAAVVARRLRVGCRRLGDEPLPRNPAGVTVAAIHPRRFLPLHAVFPGHPRADAVSDRRQRHGGLRQRLAGDSDTCVGHRQPRGTDGAERVSTAGRVAIGSAQRVAGVLRHERRRQQSRCRHRLGTPRAECLHAQLGRLRPLERKRDPVSVSRRREPGVSRAITRIDPVGGE